MIAIEEDGEDIFTPIPKMCGGWPLAHEPAPVREMMGFMRCSYCKASFGPAPTVRSEAVIDVLAHQQIYCKELRRVAPSHTYKNDREIIESMRSILGANMQIPSYEEGWLTELMRYQVGVLAWQQMLLKQVTEAYPASRDPTNCSETDSHK